MGGNTDAGRIQVPARFVLCERLRVKKSMLWGQAPNAIYSDDPRITGRIFPGDFVRILTPKSDTEGRVRIKVFPHDYRDVGKSDGQVWIDWATLARVEMEDDVFECEDQQSP